MSALSPDETAAQSAETMRRNDAALRHLGIRVLEVKPGRARLAMIITAEMLNGYGIGHGGMIFALADTAFAYACNSYGRSTVAAAASIEFLLAAKLGDELIAIAEERTRSRKSGIYDVTVRNQAGENVALFRGRSHEIGGPIASAAPAGAQAALSPPRTPRASGSA